jgi:rhamnose transport system permease protein
MKEPMAVAGNGSRASTEVSEFPPRRPMVDHFRRWEWMLVALLAVVVVTTSSLSPYFLNAVNLSRTSSDFMELGLMMLPMTFIIISGNIDISVASNLGMSASLMGVLFNAGVNIWFGAFAALVVGTYAFYRGIAFGLLGNRAATNYPASFTYLGQGLLPGTLIPFSVGLFAVLAIIFGLILHKTTFGRYLFVIGNNQEAAVYAGVPVDEVKVIVFSLSGFMSALAGLILAARFGSTRPDIGTGLELTVITVAVLGGVDINGGIGSMVGAVLALMLIGLLRFGMGLVNIQGQVQGIVIGLLLICSILFHNLAGRASLRALHLKRKSVIYALGVVLLIALFTLFFMWSRIPIISSS